MGAQYDDDVELVTADQVTQLCTGCAEGLFEYEAVPEGRLEGLRREFRWWTPEDVAKAVRGILAAVLPIAIAGGVLWAGITITNDVVSASAAEISSAAGASSVIGPLFEATTFLLICAVVLCAISMMASGGRRI